MTERGVEKEQASARPAGRQPQPNRTRSSGAKELQQQNRRAKQHRRPTKAKQQKATRPAQAGRDRSPLPRSRRIAHSTRARTNHDTSITPLAPHGRSMQGHESESRLTLKPRTDKQAGQHKDLEERAGPAVAATTAPTNRNGQRP